MTEYLGLQLPCWRVTGDVRDHPALFRSLPLLLPDDSVLVFEGGRHSKEFRAFVAEHAVPALAEIQRGTAWPRQRTYHLPTTRPFLEKLADHTEHCAAPEVCEHLHAYKDRDVLLQWFDAFSEALFVSKLVPQEGLDRFCSALGLRYVEEAGR